MQDQKDNPFKFLNAYQKEDIDFYFGRSTEVEQLFQLLLQSRLVLVYGASGTGKTSLIRCGMANRFEETSWRDVLIRRGEGINKSLINTLEKELNNLPQKKSNEQDLNWFNDLVEETPITKTNVEISNIKIENKAILLVEELYLKTFNPLYLIFDQFEELFILGEENEKKQFFKTIKALVEIDLPCTILLVMREEYLAHLYELEKLVKPLYESRLRLEMMNLEKTKTIVKEMLTQAGVQLTEQQDTINQIIEVAIDKDNKQVQLPYLQVLLGKLYNKALGELIITNNRIVFSPKLIEDLGINNLGNLLSGLLDEQLTNFIEEVNPEKNIALGFLRVLVSKQGTKIPLSRNKLIESLSSPIYNESLIIKCIQFFSDNWLLRFLPNDQFELAHDSLAKNIFKQGKVFFDIPRAPYTLPPESLYDQENNQFTEEFAGLFFGREVELVHLYNRLIFQIHRLTILYGKRAVGKTALVRAGLIPRLKSVNLEIDYFVANKKVNWEELQKKINRLIKKETPKKEQSVLIIDQFENLLTDKNNPEVLIFFQNLKQLLANKPRQRVLLVIDEDLLVRLFDYETVLPIILDNRIHLDEIKEEILPKIIQNTVRALGSNIKNPQELIDKLGNSGQLNHSAILSLCKKYYLHRKNRKGLENLWKEDEGDRPLVLAASIENKDRPLNTSSIIAFKNSVYTLNENADVELLLNVSITDLRKIIIKFQDRIAVLHFHYLPEFAKKRLFGEHDSLFSCIANMPLLTLIICPLEGRTDLAEKFIHIGVHAVMYTSFVGWGDFQEPFTKIFYKYLLEDYSLQKSFELAINYERPHYFDDSEQEENKWVLSLRNPVDVENIFFEREYLSRLMVSSLAQAAAVYLPNIFRLDSTTKSELEDYFKNRLTLLEVLPSIISKPLRQLFIVDSEEFPNNQGNQLISLIYENSIQYIYYILIAQLIRVQNADSSGTFKRLIQQTWNKQLKTNFKNINIEEIKILLNVFEMYRVEHFVEEFPIFLKYLNNQDYLLAYDLAELKKLKEETTYSKKEAKELFEKSIYSLTSWLSRIIFICNYDLISVRKIRIDASITNYTPRFIHSIKSMKIIFDQPLEENDLILNEFLQDKSIILLKKDYQDGFLSLTPFLFDGNTEDLNAKVQPYILSRNVIGQNSYEYRSLDDLFHTYLLKQDKTLDNNLLGSLRFLEKANT